MVQDVKINDFLMGDDSKSRKVLNLGRGEDIMYEVMPTKGESYTFNSEHILSLKFINIGIRYDNKTKKWLAKSFNNITIKVNVKVLNQKKKLKNI